MHTCILSLSCAWAEKILLLFVGPLIVHNSSDTCVESVSLGIEISIGKEWRCMCTISCTVYVISLPDVTRMQFLCDKQMYEN